ncbi:MAG: DUF4386 domain-containing protein [Bacillota bacterium]
MTPAVTEQSRRTAARIAGLTLILPFLIVAFAEFGIFERLIVKGDATQTAQNILAHAALFRLGIVADVLYSTGIIILLTALYRILAPVNRGIALGAAFFRLMYAVMWLEIVLNCFRALKFLGDDAFFAAFSASQAQVLTKLALSNSFDTYYVGLFFFGLASTVCSLLWFKSGYIPKALAGFGILASAWAAFCSLGIYVSPDFPKVVDLSLFDVPLVLFELALGFWLLIKGLRPAAE